MNDKFTLGSFLKQYKDDEACLERIKEIKYPKGIYCEKCQKVTNFTKIKNRPVYQCSCGFQISPLSGTIFEKTTIGGKGKNRAFKPNFNEIPKEVVMGMVQRNEQDKNGTDKGGNKVYLKHIPNTGKWTLLEQIQNHVDSKTRVITDEYYGYTQLKYLGYNHEFVKHKETYVVGDIYTQNVENLWSILKRGIYGVYRVVSKKYLQAYIDEYSWRYNNRKYQDKMFERLLNEIANIKVISQVKAA